MTYIEWLLLGPTGAEGFTLWFDTVIMAGCVILLGLVCWPRKAR